jgi:hypothetical protein
MKDFKQQSEPELSKGTITSNMKGGETSPEIIPPQQRARVAKLRFEQHTVKLIRIRNAR